MSLARPLRHLAAMGVASAALATRNASAEAPTFVTGAFIGFALGEPAGFLWGVDAHALPVHNQRGTMLGGAFFRLSCAPGSKFDLTTGVGLLARSDRTTWVGGDFGPSWRVGSKPGGFGFHLGGLALVGDRSPFKFGALAQGRFGIDGETVDGGFGLGPWLDLAEIGSDPGCSGYGRPLRIEEHVLVPRLWTLEPTGRETNVDATHAAVVAAWLDDLQSESAAVPAFLTLSHDLTLAGAPLDLVERARDAAFDEIRHANLCAALAAHYGGFPVAAPIFGAQPARCESRKRLLLRLAIESWRDGCLGEGEAAARARLALATAGRMEVRAACAQIARDEQRHADLAWDILAWTLQAGGSMVKEQLRDELTHAKTPTSLRATEPPCDRATWAAHGRTSGSANADIREITYARAVRRASGYLSQRSSGAVLPLKDLTFSRTTHDA